METPKISDWYVYVIQTHCDQLYTGISTDVERRFQEHLGTYNKSSNKGAKYFRGRSPKKVVYREVFQSRSEATKREIQIKRMSSIKKRALFA